MAGMGQGKVVVAGGTGFLGGEVVRQANAMGYDVVVLSRSGRQVEGAEVRRWDGKTVSDWAEALRGAEIVVNLAGSPIAAPWRGGRKQKLWSSRLEPTRAMGQAIAQSDQPPRAWVNVSGIGYYGDAGEEVVTEASRAGSGEVARLAADWEQAMMDFETPQTSRARVRMGMILGNKGGAWPLLRRAARFGLGGALGSGRQWQPWIHVEDAARMLLWAGSERIEGPVNGVAPDLVRNAEFMAAIRRALGVNIGLPAPGFALRLVSALMGWPSDFLTSGQKAKPEIALFRGFDYRFPELAMALADLTASRSR